MEKFFSPQGHVTLNWLVQSGKDSNSSEILYLPWLPANLKNNWSKLIALAWRHHFLIISRWECFLRTKGTWLQSRSSDKAKIWTRPRFYASPGYLHVWRRSDQKWERGDMVFTIISHGELSVAMATTVLMESAPNPKSSLSPIPLMLHIKFDQDWPTDLEIP